MHDCGALSGGGRTPTQVLIHERQGAMVSDMINRAGEREACTVKSPRVGTQPIHGSIPKLYRSREPYGEVLRCDTENAV